MSVAHSSPPVPLPIHLPPIASLKQSMAQHHQPSNNNNAHPRYGPGAGYSSAPARRPPDAPIVRLPSYKELTAASRCDDSHGRDPPPTPTGHGRSSLFTQGLIHLPPLKVPTSPGPGPSSALASASASTPTPSSTLVSTPSSSSSPSSASNLTKLLNGNGKRPAPSSSSLSPYAYEEHDREASEDEPPESKRYLDLSVHCPLPSQRERVPSPYADSQSTDSAGSRGSNMNMGQARGGYSPLGRPGQVQGQGQQGGYSAHAHAHGPASSLPVGPASASSLGYDLTHATPRLKFSHAKAGGRTKKQALSCYFCRERKIACGRPEGEVPGQESGGACNQCARRKIECRYPTVSHRGQHSRIKSAARKGLSVSSNGANGASSSSNAAASSLSNGTGVGVGVGSNGAQGTGTGTGRARAASAGASTMDVDPSSRPRSHGHGHGHGHGGMAMAMEGVELTRRGGS